MPRVKTILGRNRAACANLCKGLAPSPARVCGPVKRTKAAIKDGRAVSRKSWAGVGVGADERDLLQGACADIRPPSPSPRPTCDDHAARHALGRARRVSHAYPTASTQIETAASSGHQVAIDMCPPRISTRAHAFGSAIVTSPNPWPSAPSSSQDQ